MDAGGLVEHGHTEARDRIVLPSTCLRHVQNSLMIWDSGSWERDARQLQKEYDMVTVEVTAFSSLSSRSA